MIAKMLYEPVGEANNVNHFKLQAICLITRTMIINRIFLLGYPGRTMSVLAVARMKQMNVLTSAPSPNRTNLIPDLAKESRTSRDPRGGIYWRAFTVIFMEIQTCMFFSSFDYYIRRTSKMYTNVLAWININVQIFSATCGVSSFIFWLCV